MGEPTKPPYLGSKLVVPYDPHWPALFEREAAKIKALLGGDLLALHHVGSTSVPWLCAKPKIDILAISFVPKACVEPLQALGYRSMREGIIPLHRGFYKRGVVNVNLHLYPPNHPEIAGQILFRDYLRQHPEEAQRYAALKKAILQDPSAQEKEGAFFVPYTVRKGGFIRSVLGKAVFNDPVSQTIWFCPKPLTNGLMGIIFSRLRFTGDGPLFFTKALP